MWSRLKPTMAPAPYRALLPSRLFRAGFANAALSRHSWVVSGSLAIIGCWINRRAFSSEVGTGSREENASNKEVEPPFRFHRNGKGSSPGDFNFGKRRMKLVPDASAAPNIDALVVAMRPRLHRYCARMVGSVIDGEDVLQDALIKAVESFGSAGPLRNPEGWLFRIAHNTALDFLRRRSRQQAIQSGEEVDMIADPADTVENRQIASAS